MSRFPQGPTGGGGVRAPNPRPPRVEPRPQRREEPRDIKVADGWDGYLKDGYFDSDGNLRIEYVGRQMVEPLFRVLLTALFRCRISHPA